MSNAPAATNIFGTRVRARRLELGMTLEQVANEAGLAKSLIWDCENVARPRGISLANAASIAEVLKLSVDYLAGLTSEPNGSINLLDGLMLEEAQTVIATIKLFHSKRK